MKVLIITYYWPPAGGSGVQRWLKFVKYLRDFGVEPVVYTVEDPEYVLTDETLQKEVPKNTEILRQPIWEPNNLLSKFKSKQKQTSAGFLNPNPSFFEKKLQYIRANYFIPDARKFWVKPSVKFLSGYLKDNQIDVIITTGPPHSLHLIGLELKKKIPVKWIADFRDPWTDIDYFHQLPLNERSKQKHQAMEQNVLQNADAVLVVGKTMKEDFTKYSKNVHVITNGFDGEISKNEPEMDMKFSITHIGMMNADRNPKILWKALADISNENKDFDFEIKLIGKVDQEIRKSIQENNLDKHIVFIDYLSHKEVIKHQRAAQVLLLTVNKVPSARGIITGKIFEYLQAKRPILAIAPKDGDLAEIIGITRSGTVVDFEEKEKLKKVILDLYQRYKSGVLKIESENIEQYHRKNLTKQLAEVIKGV